MNVRAITVPALTMAIFTTTALAGFAQSPMPTTQSTAAPAAATPPTKTAATTTTNIVPSVPNSGEDALFAELSELVDDSEIVAARYVLANTKDPQIRQYAGRTAAAYALAERDLRKAAAAADIPVQQGVISPDDPRPPTELRGLTNAELGTTYLHDEVGGDARTLAAIEAEKANGTDSGLKAYASLQETLVQRNTVAASGLLATQR